MPPFLLDILKEYGPIIAFMAFYVWRDYRRENLMGNRITSLENFQKEELIQLVKEVLVALVNNTDVLKDFCEIKKGIMR